MIRYAWLCLLLSVTLLCQGRTLVGSVSEPAFAEGDTTVWSTAIGDSDFGLSTLWDCSRAADGKSFGLFATAGAEDVVGLSLTPRRHYDEQYSGSAWHLTARMGESIVCDTVLNRDILDREGRCVVSLRRRNGEVEASFNHRRVATLGAWACSVDSVGVLRAPGNRVECRKVDVEVERPDEAEVSRLGSVEEIGEYLERSRDSLEGYWYLYGFEEDGALMRKGGDYRIAIVREGDGYELLYLSGARILPGSWTPGMVKGRMRRMPGTDAFTVDWIDAEHCRMERDIYAELENGVVLNILFPRGNSRLTFRKHP